MWGKDYKLTLNFYTIWYFVQKSSITSCKSDFKIVNELAQMKYYQYSPLDYLSPLDFSKVWKMV